MLEKEISLSALDKEGNSAVHYLVRSASQPVLIEILKNLIKYDKRVIEITNSQGETPFHYIVSHNLFHVLELILKLSPPSISLCKLLFDQSTSIDTRIILQEYIVCLPYSSSLQFPSSYLFPFSYFFLPPSSSFFFPFPLFLLLLSLFLLPPSLPFLFFPFSSFRTLSFYFPLLHTVYSYSFISN